MRRKISFLLAMTAFLAAACGSTAPDAVTDDSRAEPTAPAPTAPPTSAPSAAPDAIPDFPASLEGVGFSIYLEERPEAIVSLSPSATEILFAIGAGPQVAAADRLSNHPPEAPAADLDALTATAEDVAAYQPDLVIISYDPGGLMESLEAMGIPVIIQGPAPSMDQAFDQMLQLGIATGHETEALALGNRLREEIRSLGEQLRIPGEERTYYFELDEDLFSVTSQTLQGEAVSIFGFENIADPLLASAGYYPQLTAEYIADQDPEIIFFICSEDCDAAAQSIAGRDGWGSIKAVRNGRIIGLDAELADRWGPRMVDLVRQVGESIPPPDVATETSGAAESDFPVTVTGTGFSATLPERPEAIISLSPTATEMLFAIGAGPQVAAVDDQSDFPEGIPESDLSGFQPNVEAIAAYEPDLAVISYDPGDLADSLETLGVPVILQGPAADLEQVYEQLRQLGAATGRLDEAEDLNRQMQDRIDQLAEQYGPAGAGLTFYYELDDTFYSAASSTIQGQMFGLFGLENITDGLESAAGTYPQLSAEYIVESDPDLIFFGCGEFCSTTAESIAAREGWDSIKAVRNGDIIALDADVSSRWGPRLADFAQLIGESLPAGG